MMRDNDSRLIWEQWGEDAKAAELYQHLIKAILSDNHEEAENAYSQLKPLLPSGVANDSLEILNDLGIDIEEGREDDDDRYWETWEIRAVTSDAMKKWGTHIIDWEFQDERSRTEIADIVLRSLIQRGTPVIFTGYKS
jgi:hypothetical protein